MTMKTHYSEADLLETYYLQPGESMPVMMHLADCSACAERYERLERKLRQAASCDTAGSAERPATFWSRQRHLVMRSIDARGRRTASIARTTRVAAAAALSFLLGAAVVYRSVEPALELPPAPVVRSVRVAPHPVSVASAPKSDEPAFTHDAWQTDELADFHSVVQWESWEADNKSGDQL
jgi:hypothetical protein